MILPCRGLAAPLMNGSRQALRFSPKRSPVPCFGAGRWCKDWGRAGYRDLQPSPAHVLLSIRHDKSLILDSGGSPPCASSNFELMQKVSEVKPNSITASGP